MSQSVKIEFAALGSLHAEARKAAGKTRGPRALVIFTNADFEFGAATRDLIGDGGEALIRKAATAAKFKGKPSTALDILAPGGFSADRLLVIGVGPQREAAKPEPQIGAAPATIKPAAPLTPADYATLGGFVVGKLGRGSTATIVFDPPRAPDDGAAAAAEFRARRTPARLSLRPLQDQKKDEFDENGQSEITLAVADPAAARIEAKRREAVAAGVLTARSLVNEPANVLYPDEFANRVKELGKVGVEVEVLDEPAMKALGMWALLGVGQGSARQSRVVVMRWRGGKGSYKGKAQPVAFIGKGVTFDTGGISIKPAAGMEDMKGDMAGAACVVGLMQALAARKAKLDAIGVIGLVENMPGANAQRPGDIVKSMSGQTIEIINTDAEGRLVLGDLLWYVQDSSSRNSWSTSRR